VWFRSLAALAMMVLVMMVAIMVFSAASLRLL
jgi:hypothetical protein